MQIPTRDDILQMMLTEIYPPGIINNAHRGDLVEMMVLRALGPPWKLVGLGWHPWDLPYVKLGPHPFELVPSSFRPDFGIYREKSAT